MHQGASHVLADAAVGAANRMVVAAVACVAPAGMAHVVAQGVAGAVEDVQDHSAAALQEPVGSVVAGDRTEEACALAVGAVVGAQLPLRSLGAGHVVWAPAVVAPAEAQCQAAVEVVAAAEAAVAVVVVVVVLVLAVVDVVDVVAAAVVVAAGAAVSQVVVGCHAVGAVEAV